RLRPPRIAPARRFLPPDYQPRSPYPLVVLWPRPGGNEERVARLAPRLSRRNFIAISLRGPQELGRHAGGWAAFGWGPAAADDSIEDYLLAAVEQTPRGGHPPPARGHLPRGGGGGRGGRRGPGRGG